MANPEFSLDDFLLDTEAPQEVEAIEEPVIEEEIDPELAEEFIYSSMEGEARDEALAELRRKLTGEEEVISGEIVEYIPVVEGTVMPDVSTEKTPLEIAAEELKAIQESGIQNKAEQTALRTKLAEMKREIQAIESQLYQVEEKHWEIKRKEREAEAHISEEKHREAERKREEEIQKRKRTAMSGFKSHIDDLNPEWKDYAFNHQWEGASTLALHDSGLLADEMGLGKSLTAIMWADMTKAKRILVLTPSDTCTNFTLEWAMWAKHRFVWTLANNNKQARSAMMETLFKPRTEADQDFVLTINYEQLYSDMDFFSELIALDFDTVIVDEFHNAKGKNSLIFQRLKAMRHTIKRILPMTGTFILNKPQDIWTALHLVDPDSFPTEKSFLQSYCEYNHYNGKWEFRPGGERSMLTRLGGRIVKRNMEEAGIKIPTQHFHTPWLNFDGNYEDQRSIIRQLAEHSQIILDSDRKIAIVEQIALITRQRQAIVWPAGIEIKDPETKEVLFSVGDEVRESIKIDWVENKIKELRNANKRIAVFSQFKTGLAELESRLSEAGFRVVRYDGDTDNSTKALVKRDFDRRHVELNNGEYQWDIVLCNFKTGGVGLNFTHITEMIMLDEEWNPGKNKQAYKRTARIGQTEETNVWIPRVNKSIDQWMLSLNEQKAQLIEGFDTEVDLTQEFNEFLAVMKERV